MSVDPIPTEAANLYDQIAQHAIADCRTERRCSSTLDWEVLRATITTTLETHHDQLKQVHSTTP